QRFVLAMGVCPASTSKRLDQRVRQIRDWVSPRAPTGHHRARGHRMWSTTRLARPADGSCRAAPDHMPDRLAETPRARFATRRLMGEALEGIAGAVFVALVLLDVFLSVVVPRRAPRAGQRLRVTAYLVPGLWVWWRWLGLRVSSAERRAAFLGTFGALVVIVLVGAWVAGLVAGYGLLLDALRAQLRPAPENLGASLYFAGTSFLTLGFGDVVAVGGYARVVAMIAAANGLGLFALVITLLFTLYGSFQRREVAVVVLEAGAGAPPSGVTLLATYALAGILVDLPRVFAEWQAWAAEGPRCPPAVPVPAALRSK